ncbi:hypothetical protein ACKWTF_015381 [Chironomus riparius]
MNKTNNFDILYGGYCPKSEGQLIVITKQFNLQINDEMKNECQILKFSSELTPKEIYTKILTIDLKSCPNLLIIVVNDECEMLPIDHTIKVKIPLEVEILKKCFKKLKFTRSTFLVMTSKIENKSKIYLKEPNSEELLELDCQKFVEAVDEQLLNLLIEKEEKSENSKMLEIICDKFLKIPLNLDENYKINASIDLRHDDLKDKKVSSLENPSSSSNLQLETSKVFQNFEKMSQQQMLDDVKDHKFVVIKNKPGFGRSWVLWNLTNQLREKHPNKWITYVDLKHFIQELKEQETEFKFTAFMTEKIFKLSTKLEAEIFKKLYKNGKICILFNGFDEITADCAEFVIKIFQSFQQNGGNQLWIAKSDSLAPNFKDKLQIDAVFNLDEPKEKSNSFLTKSCDILLQHEVRTNPSLEFHTELWTVIKNYFNSKDILQMIHYSCSVGFNLLFTTNETNSDEIIELTLFEVILVFRDLLRNHRKSQNNQNFIKTLITENYSICDLTVLHTAAKSLKTGFHENIWALLENIFENRMELKNLIMQKDQNDNNYVHCLVMSNIPKYIKYALHKLQKIFKGDQYEEILISRGSNGRNLLHLVTNEARDTEIQRLIWDTYRNLSKTNEKFLDVLKEVDNDGTSMFHIAAGLPKPETFNYIVKEAEKIASQEDLKNTLSTIGFNGKNLLQLAAKPNKSVDFDHNFWKTIEKLFTNHDILDMMKHNDESGSSLLSNAVGIYSRKIAESTLNEAIDFFFEDKSAGPQKFKDFLLQKDDDGINFLHYLVTRQKIDKIELIFNKIQDNQGTSDDFYQEIWFSKGESERNLLQIAVINLEDISLLISLWTIYRRILKTDKQFLTFLKDVDRRGNNIFHLAASFSGKFKVFEFIVKGLDIFTSFEDVKDILSMHGCANRNLLQSAVEHNKKLDFHENLWKIIQNYFNSSEILGMIKHVDTFGDNIFGISVQRTTDNIFRFMLNTTNVIFGASELFWCLKNIFQILINEKSEFKLKTFWREMENFFGSQNLLTNFKSLISQKASNLHANVLQLAVTCENIEFHEALWSLLLRTFDKSELKDLIAQKNEYGNDLIHVHVIYCRSKIIELLLKKLKENFQKAEFQGILTSTGQHCRNLLQKAACSSKDIRIHQVLWKNLQHFFQPAENFLEFIKSADNHQNTVLHLAACFSSKEIFEFTIFELERITTRVELRKMLSTPGFRNRNLLQSSARQNQSIKLHQSLWKIIEKYFEPPEITAMIKHTSLCNNNVFFYAVGCNTKEVVMLTFYQISKFINKNNLFDYLSISGFIGRGMLQTALFNKSNPEVHKFCVELLKKCELEVEKDSEIGNHNSTKKRLISWSKAAENDVKRRIVDLKVVKNDE